MSNGFVGFCLSCCAGLVIGGVTGVWMATDVHEYAASKDQLRVQCIEGNENACRIYMADYGKGGEW